MVVRFGVLALLLTACAEKTYEYQTPVVEPPGSTNPSNPTEPVDDVDSDGDGLLDSDEAKLGTDPDLVDTDGDGWEDGEEVDGNTDPLEASDHPYAGGWPIDACRDDVNATGNGMGQTADDFALMDQNGEAVSLHDFCGKSVLLVSSAMWCGPCQAEAAGLQDLYEHYEEQGFLVITLLGENHFGGDSTQQNLQTWADAAGITHPVVADDGWGVTARFLNSGSLVIPTMHLIGPGGEVLARDTWVTEFQVANSLP